MKAIYSLLFGLLLYGTSEAQSITRAEYFFDTDPGVGAAIPFAVNPGNAISISNGSIATAGLDGGFHNLAMRMLDVAGIWSQTEIRPFFITALSVATSSVQAAEYFFDTDPGVGMATAIAIPAGNNINASLVIPVLSLPAGFHNLVVRVKNNSGEWSQREVRPFYIVADDFITRSIVAAEYFIDTDPGIGNAAAINVAAPTPSFNADTRVPVSLSVGEGQHFLFVRVKDNLNRWSLFSLDTFTIARPLPVSGMQLRATATSSIHLLQWTTQTEINTRHFEVEHSTNGVNFTLLDKVAAAGNSGNLLTYRFTAVQPAAGMHFYRLAQMDIDGHLAYSNIAVIQNNLANANLAVYPNPAKGMIQLRFSGKEKKVLVQITDVQGRSVLRTLLTNQPALQLNTSGLTAGMYLVQVTDGATTEVARFTKE